MKKLIFVILGTLLIISAVVAQDISDVTTTLVNSATDLPAFGTRGAKKVTIFFVMPDSTDTLMVRVTGAADRTDTFTNLNSNGDTTSYALSSGQDAWAFAIVINNVPPFMKIEVDSLAYTNNTVWTMSTGTRFSDEVVKIRTVFEY